MRKIRQTGRRRKAPDVTYLIVKNASRYLHRTRNNYRKTI